MRIQCASLDDFLENLKDVAVHRNVVYVNRTKRFMGNTKTSSNSYEVFFAASAVLVFGDSTEALLEYGETCGVDRGPKDGGPEGTIKQTELYAALSAFCDDRKLMIKPGIIDM